MDKIKKKYSNGEINVIWEPDLCDHSAICFRSLPEVFIPSKRPWINPNAASTSELIKTIKRCPTKALKYEIIEQSSTTNDETNAVDNTIITILKDGPYLLDGNFKIIDNEGNEVICENSIALCRCGASQKKPFCDGAHNSIGFID
jgi:uncharacterized Fe-S cluster protein YjdI